MAGLPAGLTHNQIWTAIDALAAQHGYSPSGLARQAGLDPTTFNRSKRTARGGKLRWPSTESIAKVLQATGATLTDFVGLIPSGTRPATRLVPLIGFAQAGRDGYFDDGGFPAGSGWEEIAFPGIADDHAYALEISGDSMMPAYRNGDVVVVSPQASLRRGDRVIVKTVHGEVMAKTLVRQTARRIELGSLNPEFESRVLDTADVAWMARIVWVSQ